MSWYSHCCAFAQSRGIDPSTLRVLDAFGQGSHPGVLAVPMLSLESVAPDLLQASSFEALESDMGPLSVRLSDTIAEQLEQEVDARQAKMFARRFQGVLSILRELAKRHVESRLLQVGLVGRMAEILCGPLPRVLRVRAISDFYYSQAALLQHRSSESPHPPLEEFVQSATWTSVAKNLAHTTIAALTKQGPVHINLLRGRGLRLAMYDSRSAIQQAPFQEWVQEQGAVAGVSGGFFLYSETDIASPSQQTDPVGLLVHEGQILNPPVLQRSSLLQYQDGTLCIKTIGMKQVTVHWGSGHAKVAATNSLSAIGQAPVALNRALGREVGKHSLPGLSLVGNEVVDARLGLNEIPLAGCLLLLPNSNTPLPPPGTPVTYQLPTENPSPIQSAMAGGPMLWSQEQETPVLSLVEEDFAGTAPPVTFSQDETFDQNLLPRMAVGITATQEVVFAAIDGRNFQQAPGFTLQQTGHLMKMLGCRRAMNLDGGSSKRMAIQGKIVDLPSTEVLSIQGAQDSPSPRVRPVHSAILIFTSDSSSQDRFDPAKENSEAHKATPERAHKTLESND